MFWRARVGASVDEVRGIDTCLRDRAKGRERERERKRERKREKERKRERELCNSLGFRA